MPGLGLSIVEVAGRVRAPDPATAALIARMTAPPGPARAGLIDALVRTLKEAGLWAKLDLLYLLAAHDAQAARLNWAQSGFALTPVNAPGFTADRGYAGDGATGYLDTGWSPAANGARFALNDAAFGCWLNGGTDTPNGGVAIGCLDGSNNGIQLVTRSTAGPIRARLNQASAANSSGGSVATAMGFTAVSRTATTLVTVYRDAAINGTFATASSGLPAASLALGGLYNGASGIGSCTDSRIAFAFAGAGLSGPETAALHAAARTYLTAVGAA